MELSMSFKNFPKRDEVCSRRQVLTSVLQAGALVVGAGALLSACKDGGGKTAAPAAPTGAAICDAKKLPRPAQAQRTALKYVDQTPVAGKNCANCKLYKPGKPCNGCTLIKGPVEAKGYCTAWAAKA